MHGQQNIKKKKKNNNIFINKLLMLHLFGVYVIARLHVCMRNWLANTFKYDECSMAAMQPTTSC